MNSFVPLKKISHRGHEQLIRQSRAMDLQMDHVDFDAQTGTIKNYDVSLESCTCPDFQRRQRPCKHMYRLAMEPGIFTADAEKVTAAVNSPKNILRTFKSRTSEPVPKNFVVIDFETANNFFDSVCQIGLAVVENNSVTFATDFMIRPPYEDFIHTNIHGITFNDVRGAATFDALWRQIENFIAEQNVAAYHLPFDMSCLITTLARYKIPCPKFAAFDILANVRECRYYSDKLEELDDYSLVTVAKKLRIKHVAHDALSDAVVAAKVQLYLTKNFPDEQTTIYRNISL